jgi:hypothetical protein
MMQTKQLDVLIIHVGMRAKFAQDPLSLPSDKWS